MATETLNPLSANPTKWSNKLKQFVGSLPTNCLSVFDHFVGLVLKALKATKKQFTLIFTLNWVNKIYAEKRRNENFSRHPILPHSDGTQRYMDRWFNNPRINTIKNLVCCCLGSTKVEMTDERGRELFAGLQ